MSKYYTGKKTNQLDYHLAFKIRNMALGSKSAEQRSRISEGLPVFLTISDTIRCNLNCIMCQRNSDLFQPGVKPFLKRFSLTRRLTKSSSHYKNKTVMDFSLFDKIAKEVFPYLFTVSLSVAGEPFMNPNFFKEIELINRYSAKLSIFTNATLLPKGKLMLKFINNLSYLRVSIDAATKKTYESIRRGANFESVLNNIKRFNECRNRLVPEKRPKLVFWCTLMRRNIEELPAYIKLAYSLQAEAIGLCHMIVFKKRLENESLIYHKELANRYIREAKELVNNFGLKTLNFPPLFLDKEPQGNKDPNLSNVVCRFLWQQSFIELNGDVFPCCAPQREGLWMGNIAKHSFKEIWNGKQYQQLRASFKDGNFLPPCKNCYQRLKENTSDNSQIYFSTKLL